MQSLLVALHRLRCFVALNRREYVCGLVDRVVGVRRSGGLVVVTCCGVKATASDAVDVASTVGGLDNQGSEGRLLGGGVGLRGPGQVSRGSKTLRGLQS